MSISAALALASCKAFRLARCASVGCSLDSISAAGQSVAPDCAAVQLCASEPPGFPGGALVALILPKRGKPGLLLVVQQIVELIQRRLHRCRPLRSSLRSASAWRRAGLAPSMTACVGHAALMSCAAFTEALARSSRAARWASFGWMRLLDLIDRQASNVAAVVAAHLRQFVRRRICGRCSAARIAAACRMADSRRDHHSHRGRTGRHRCHCSRSPRTSVAPNSRTPHRIVVHVVIGERPEQRADPAIATIAMPPPSAAAPVVPSRGRSTCRDPGARARIAQRAGVMQCARDRT